MAIQPTIFIVDDDRGLLRLIDKALQREGFSTRTASSGESALKWLLENHAALLLLDLKLQDIEGKVLIQQLSETGRCPPFIIITGQGDERVAVDMMKRGAMDYLVKDVDFLQFVPEVVKRVLEQLDNQRRLAEAEEQINLVQSVVEQGFSAVLITDADLPDPRVVYINPAFAKATGYSREIIAGQRLSTLAGLTNVHKRLRDGLGQGQPFIEEISTYQTTNGEGWGEWRVGPVKDRRGQNTHWLFIFRDITERKRLEKEILEISDRERQRIGQDLHDGLCQHLAGIELMSQVLQQKLAGKSKAGSVRAGEIANYVREAISQTRALVRGLSPVTLESEGLRTALAELAANTEKMFGVECRLKADGSVPVKDPAVATHLYRIAQEAVSNAIKHGKATEIVLQLELVDREAQLSVCDNGASFPASGPNNTGMGLRIMQSRAGLIGALLSIAPRLEGGTRVLCIVPAANLPKTESP